ncbi:alpha-1,2-Mannosidase [Dirofilaria immitis]|nr:alpha-1,2-Mannosidase [Dirofilaria immitis]
MDFVGPIFFLMIPCTYIFMALYALINLNIINWGTREAASIAAGKHASDTELHNLLQRLGFFKIIDFARLTSSLRSNTNAIDIAATAAAAAAAEMEKMKKRQIAFSSSSTPLKTLISKENMHRFLWMDTEYLQVCSRGRLNAAEDEFWNGMIEQYLKPLEITEEETRQDVANLASLRNRIASLVLIVNGLLWSKLSKKTGKFELTDEPLKVEPIGLFVIAFLLIILVVQTCGMFAHRINTLLGAFHEVSNIEDFNFSNKNIEDEDEIMKNAQQMFDTTLYENAHGTDGYVRVHYNTHAACNLYKLQRAKLIHQSSATQRNEHVRTLENGSDDNLEG